MFQALMILSYLALLSKITGQETGLIDKKSKYFQASHCRPQNDFGTYGSQANRPLFHGWLGHQWFPPG